MLRPAPKKPPRGTKGAKPAPARKPAPAHKPAPARKLGKADEAARIRALCDRLEALYPDAHCELDFENPFQLLVATILSAQCTDKRVNLVTPVLFARFPDAASMAAADPLELESIIRSTGFFRNKAKSILGASRRLCDHFGGG